MNLDGSRIGASSKIIRSIGITINTKVTAMAAKALPTYKITTTNWFDDEADRTATTVMILKRWSLRLE